MFKDTLEGDVENNKEQCELPNEIIDCDEISLFPNEIIDCNEISLFPNEIDVEIKELSNKEVNELQKEAIKEAFDKISSGIKLTDAEKGNFGEMLMDQYYTSEGYTPIHSPKVIDLEHKSGQGIDGVYEKITPDGSNEYVIADAKVNFSKLSKGLADGTDQMSDAWIEKRLDNAVGKQKADEIRDAYEDNVDSVSKTVYHFSYSDNGDGICKADISYVDSDGNQGKNKVEVQNFDKYGIEINGGDK